VCQGLTFPRFLERLRLPRLTKGGQLRRRHDALSPYGCPCLTVGRSPHQISRTATGTISPAQRLAPAMPNAFVPIPSIRGKKESKNRTGRLQTCPISWYSARLRWILRSSGGFTPILGTPLVHLMCRLVSRAGTQPLRRMMFRPASPLRAKSRGVGESVRFLAILLWCAYTFSHARAGWRRWATPTAREAFP